MDTGNTAWVLISTALVLFMTPGLALFYGGMVRSKNVLGMLMQNFFAMGLLAILWVAIVFSLAFGDAGNGGFIGNFDYAFLKDVTPGAAPGGPDSFLGFLTIPFVLFCAYQMTFAIITPALITGATADRLKFSAYAIFIGLWLILVYGPVAHWVFGGGFLAELGALDFAGGAVVHMNAGAAAVALVIILGVPQGLPRDAHAPAQPPADDHRHRHPVVRMGRVQRRLGARRRRHRGPGDHEHLPRRVGRHARLVGRGADAERARHDARGRLGCRRRPGRHHALRRLRRRDGARSTSASSPAPSATWRSASSGPSSSTTAST